MTATRRLREKLARLHAHYERLAELAVAGDLEARSRLRDLGFELFRIKEEIRARRQASLANSGNVGRAS